MINAGTLRKDTVIIDDYSLIGDVSHNDGLFCKQPADGDTGLRGPFAGSTSSLSLTILVLIRAQMNASLGLSSGLLDSNTTYEEPEAPQARHGNPVVAFIIGLAIILLASILNAAGLNLTKLDHVRAHSTLALRNIVLTGHVGPYKRYTEGSEKERLATTIMAVGNGVVHVSDNLHEPLSGLLPIRTPVYLR